jgi:hypothetical protein
MATKMPAMEASPRPAARSGAKRLPLATPPPPATRDDAREMVATRLPVGDIGHECFLTEILRHAVLVPLMTALDKRLPGELA